MITAETDTESYGFATDLKKILPPGDVWEYLARAQPNSQPIEAARVALTCFNWVVYQTDQFPFLLTALQAPQEMVEITLMRRGFSACLRLPDDELLVAPGFSVDEVMGRCSYRLGQLEKE